VERAFPLEDTSSIRTAAAASAASFPCDDGFVEYLFFSRDWSWERTATLAVLKDVSVALIFAGARLPTLAFGRFLKSFAGGAMLLLFLCDANNSCFLLLSQ
jgi:hypothetical protein